MNNYRKLRIWNEAMELAVWIYRSTRDFPVEERFGLTAQLRSAAVSVSSNIAEGAGRGDAKDSARFLRMAMGSLAELDSQLELATRLGMTEPDAAREAMIRTLRGGIQGLHSKYLGLR